MYTEEEATKIFCLLPDTGSPECPAPTCCGSKCMAWRWCDDIKHCSNCNDMSIFDRVEGYCGLAGKP